MPNLNLVQLMGNLTRDPEIEYTPKGTAVTKFGLAINEYWTDDSGKKMESTTFVEVNFWGKSAETIGEFCKKGAPLYVQGKLKLDQWEDKQTGAKRSKLYVVGATFQLLSRREQPKDEDAPPNTRQPQGGAQRQTETQRDQPARPHNPTPQKHAPPHDPDLDPRQEDDIPF